MKTLDELYYELRQHQDCIHLDIIDKDRVIDDVKEAMEYFDEDYVFELETLHQLALQWYNEHKEILKLRLQNYYSKNDGYWEFDYDSIQDWFEKKISEIK